MANKVLGQHFLKNAGVIKKIIAAIAPEKGDVVFEVGPGHGELTIPLVEAYRGLDAKIMAIEKDAALAERLGAELEKNMSGAKAVKGDAAEILKELARGPVKVVGNIPYYLTGHLFRILGELPDPPTRAVFMVQSEVAERMIASPPKMNRLAASVGSWATATIVASVPKENFSPKPKVDSALILLEKKADALDRGAMARYDTAVHAIFAQPRKTIFNNLRAGLENEKGILAALEKIGVDPGARPHNLSVHEIAELAKALF